MFRVKIALLSVTISAAVLITFFLFFLSVINRVGMDRIDREILTMGESQLHVWHPIEHWQELERSILSIYGQPGWKKVIVQVTNVDHKQLYQSPHWPREINTTLFSKFDSIMETDLALGGTDSMLRPGAGGGGQRFDSIGPPEGGGLLPFVGPHLPVDNRFGRPQHPPVSPAELTETKKSYFRTVQTKSGTWRTGIMGNRHITILFGMDLAGFHEDAKRYQKSFLFILPVALLLLAGGGWLIAHRALKPVSLIAGITEQINARGLDQRIPYISADDELQQLIEIINKMLERLEKSFEQAVRFSADTAHELQTPLTILQGQLDDALQHTAAGSMEQLRYSSLLEEVQRLKSIVRKLLILARVDAGQLGLHLIAVDISEMISLAVEDAGVIGPNLAIEIDVIPGVMVKADPDLLMLVIQNLTSNGVKHNHDDGLVRFKLTVDSSHAYFTISNTGDQIPEQAREMIFNRFYRLDESRSDRTPGTGLGLSLAREIIRAHNGDLSLHDDDQDMNTFTLSIPLLVQSSHRFG